MKPPARSRRKKFKMTSTTILFIDTSMQLDGLPVACVPITDVPLVKRIVIDLRRAGFLNIFVVADARVEAVERILDDVKRTDFRRRLVTDTRWRGELTGTGEDSVIVLTADRLSDYRVLENMARVNAGVDHKTLIAVILKDHPATSIADKRFMPNDGRVVLNIATSEARFVGVYRFPVEELIKFDEFNAAYFEEKAAEYRTDGWADYFDIGNGFVEVIDSPLSVKSAEKRLIRYAWKSTDGVHARLNKKIILPVLKLLLRTPVTPNMVSMTAAIVSLLSGYYFAKGYYMAAIIGALLAFVSSWIDHIDGGIARIKSKESAFGAHFDTFCDHIFYFSLAIGLTVGLYRETDNLFYIGLGIAALFGVVISLVTTTYHRRISSADASLYAAETHKRLDENAGNPIIRLGRTTYFVARRPALPYYLFVFTVLDLLPVILFMTALGTNLFWMFHFYVNNIYQGRARRVDRPRELK